MQRTKPIYWEWKGGDNQDFIWPSIGIRDGEWKLLVNKERQMMELYDLENDWAEKHDFAVDNPEVVQQLSKKLDAWKSSLPVAPNAKSLSKTRKKFSK